MVLYYEQRSSAGLIVSEATQIAPEAQGYLDTPGIYSPAQLDGWRAVTAAVHAKGAASLHNSGTSAVFLMCHFSRTVKHLSRAPLSARIQTYSQRKGSKQLPYRGL